MICSPAASRFLSKSFAVGHAYAGIATTVSLSRIQGMESFHDITRVGRLRRFRKLACAALESYGLVAARLSYLCYNGNVIYRVEAPGKTPIKTKAEPYVNGRYVLRIHMDYHTTTEIESELQWLLALRTDRDAAVPEPVSTSAGQLVLEVNDPALPGIRKCSLLRWLDGRFISKKLGPAHVKAWGRLMARFHEHAAHWKIPRGFIRRHRNWDGLFGNSAGFEFPPGELWAAIPERYRESFEVVTGQLRTVMREMGTGPDVYGLVHADLDVNTNVLFKNGVAGAIDFDDCCFAYWLHDLAFALGPWQGAAWWTWVRDAFLSGYAELRPLPNAQLKHLDLFVAGFNANLMLWMIDWAKLVPRSNEPGKHITHYGDNLNRYVENP